MQELRIVFLGTPEFAVSSLRTLVEAGKQVIGVVTAPDRPKGRGKQLAASEVKKYAVSVGLPVLQPTNLKEPGFLEKLASLKADIQIVVAFRMLPEIVWSMPRLGTFNLHASLLPDYRGAAPINWTIINGEKKTGVTTFFLKHEIDTGNILFQEEEEIRPTDNAGDLYHRLMIKGGHLVLKTLNAIASDNYSERPQELAGEHKPAPKIFRADCQVDWTDSATSIFNFVRGLSPYPAAWTIMHEKTIKLLNVTPQTNDPRDTPPGTFSSDGKNYLMVTAGVGTVKINVLQPEGKRKMNTQEFLRGYKWPKSEEKQS